MKALPLLIGLGFKARIILIKKVSRLAIHPEVLYILYIVTKEQVIIICIMEFTDNFRISNGGIREK